MMLRLHQEKAFAKLLHTAATKFNGKDPMQYAPWKRAFKLEIASLHLTPTQELTLLEARTDLEPNQIIKELNYVHLELGPDVALQMIWDSFNKVYATPYRPAQQLLKKLVQGPSITFNDSSGLIKLSIQCRSALKL